MALSSGSKLGPYEILSQVGAGGMGEVYRARDTRLDRIVAIKILAAHLSSNPDLKQRFDREARTISSLSDPHICALYDIGQTEGLRRPNRSFDSLFVLNPFAELPLKLFRLDLVTGRRELWKEVMPADPAGFSMINLVLTPDGKSYAYGYTRDISELYLIEGLQ